MSGVGFVADEKDGQSHLIAVNRTSGNGGEGGPMQNLKLEIKNGERDGGLQGPTSNPPPPKAMEGRASRIPKTKQNGAARQHRPTTGEFLKV